MTGRQARKLLRKAGYAMLRENGKHQVWGRGERWLSLPHNPAPELYGLLAHKVRKMCAGGATSHMKGATL